MQTGKRSLRSNAPATKPPPTAAPSPPPVPSPLKFTVPSTTSTPSSPPIKLIPRGSVLLGLAPAELTLLRRKQAKLSSTAASTLLTLPLSLTRNSPSPFPPPSSQILTNALLSTLIFAQHAAGTAVCIDPAGWILTCAHCFGDDEEEYAADSKRRWLLFYTGLVVQVECRFWDPRRDLALLKVVAIESDSSDLAGETLGGDVPRFAFVSLGSSDAVSVRTPIVCIGQPGAEDLESASQKRTKYSLVAISKGAFRGMVPGTDPQNNSEIGTLMHDAWTYWGHSGAPLLREDGSLLGLHSSWDEETGMRRGVPSMAIRAFLRENLPGIVDLGIATVQQSPLNQYSKEDEDQRDKALSCSTSVGYQEKASGESVVIGDD